jgi:hypothetical protein
VVEELLTTPLLLDPNSHVPRGVWLTMGLRGIGRAIFTGPCKAAAAVAAAAVEIAGVVLEMVGDEGDEAELEASEASCLSLTGTCLRNFLW